MKMSSCTRILLMIMALVMVISLVACAPAPVTPTEPSVPTNPTNPTEPTDPPHTLLPPQTPNRVSYKRITRADMLGMVMRELTIKAGLGGEKVVVSQLTDIHLNFFGEEDLKDPILKETYDRNPPSRPEQTLKTLQNIMKLAAEDSDLITLTGDIFNFHTQANMQTLKEHVFGKYDNILAILGNHDLRRQDTDCTTEDPMSQEDLRASVAANWCNDITYESQIIKDKVMVIGLDNATYQDGKYHFLPEQVPLLAADLQKARENGYVVLLFYHVPVLTGDPSDDEARADGNYSSREKGSFGTTEGPHGGGDLVGAHSAGADKEIYDLITNNGDIIYGAFCGHMHGDFYTEIHAKTAAGEEIMIPQYIIESARNDSGHFLKITIE